MSARTEVNNNNKCLFIVLLCCFCYSNNNNNKYRKREESADVNMYNVIEEYTQRDSYEEDNYKNNLPRNILRSASSLFIQKRSWTTNRININSVSYIDRFILCKYIIIQCIFILILILFSLHKDTKSPVANSDLQPMTVIYNMISSCIISAQLIHSGPLNHTKICLL